MLYFQDKPYDVIVSRDNLAGIKPSSDRNYLYFQAEEDNAYVYLVSQESFNMVLEYSTDGHTWATWGYSTSQPLRVFNTIHLPVTGNYVFIRAINTNSWTGTNNTYNYFVLSPKKVSAGGSVMSLLGNTVPDDSPLSSYQFYGLFQNCSSLTAPPELPATTLASSCYGLMFNRCTALTTAPALPATTLEPNCYDNMFGYCASLTSAPALPATTLANSCYNYMFNGCTSLTTAPALPATTLMRNCYYYMFQNCTSLTIVPELPATTLVQSCYQGMFYGCSSLTTAPALPATTLVNSCYNTMFSACTSLVNPPALPSTTMATFCYSSMFSGCTALTTAPVLPATTLNTQCYGSMFYGCTALTTAPVLPATVMANSCYSYMFSGCTSLVTPPALPATKLDTQCYQYMFKGCTSLASAPVLPGVELGNGCYKEMFYGCTSLTTGADIQAGTITSSSSNCCTGMYYNCSNLSSAYTPNITGTWTASYFTNWLYGVASTGTLRKPNDLDMTGYTDSPSGLPVGWSTSQYVKTVTLSAVPSDTMRFTYSIEDGTQSQAVLSGESYTETIPYGKTITLNTNGYENMVFCNGEIFRLGGDGYNLSVLPYGSYIGGSTITVKETTGLTHNAVQFVTQVGGSCTVSMTHNGTNGSTTKPFLYISTDSTNWTSWDGTAQTVSDEGVVSVVGVNKYGIATSFSDYSKFVVTGQGDIDVKGNVMSLIDPTCQRQDVPDYCFAQLFDGCSAICATPELPATDLGVACYYYMFNGCSSLEHAPTALPATILSASCYGYMFQGCSSLTTAPELLGTTLAASCYQLMFYNCSRLSYVKIHAAVWNSSYTINWLGLTAANGTIEKPTGTSMPEGNGGIPSGWTIVNF